MELINQSAITKPRLVFAVQLTGPLDGDFELSSAGSFGVNLEVCGLFHPQALRLQTTTLSSAQAGITCCGETHKIKVSERNRHRGYSDSNAMRMCEFSSGFSWEGWIMKRSTMMMMTQRWRVPGKLSAFQLSFPTFLLPCTLLMCLLSIYLIPQSKLID